MLRLSKPTLALALLVMTLGCGAGRIPPTPLAFPIPITASPEIATGAWSIEGNLSPGTYGVLPIGGFYGALTASGTDVQGSFDIASADPGKPYQPSACLGQGSFANALVNLSGTASNGTLTLDGTLVGGHVHIAALLSADRTYLLSGTYTVTGPCATTSPGLDGFYNAPVTGTYVGQLADSNGVTQTTTAVLTQESSFYEGGFILVDGTLTFQAGSCTSTATLDGSYVVGLESLFNGHIGPGPASDTLLLTEEDDTSSKTITVDYWNYISPTCGNFLYNGQYAYLYKQ